MKIVVLGGNGTMGARVVRLLELAGHEVVAASRSTGIDAYAGTGLADSFAGADAVVDCLNIVSMKANVCVDFYETTARNVIRAAEDARVAHLVCVSIVNARNPEINRRMGYYRGKAAQKRDTKTPGFQPRSSVQHSGLNLRRHSSTRCVSVRLRWCHG